MPSRNMRAVAVIKPTLLLIMDGWGISSHREGNAIALAKTPVYSRMLRTYPYTRLAASGKSVGLPEGQEGNSEAGHLNIGAGRIVVQDAVKISNTIKNRTFFKNPAFLRSITHVQRHHSTLHLMGLLSNKQSAHSSPDHVLALLKLARRNKNIKTVLHLFTDGRDSPRFDAIQLLKQLKPHLHDIRIRTIAGRFYAMDRANHWDRIQLVYDMLTLGGGNHARTPEEAILQAYNRNETDEFIIPTVIARPGEAPAVISSNDAVIFFNLRSDRARQLTKAFLLPSMPFFKRQKTLANIVFVAMTDFGPDLDTLSAFPSEDIKQTLPIALKAYRQLYVAESEKYAHMSYFFNGGYNHPVAKEDRLVIPSPEVHTYDQFPAMSTDKIVSTVEAAIAKRNYEFIAINIAAPDMVSHTGNLHASIKAVEVVDAALARLEKAMLKVKGYFIVTADHGNIEGLKNPKTREVDTEHSTNPVPFILIGSRLPHTALRKSGKLGDIAPTICDLFHLRKPKEMTGSSLIEKRFRLRI